MSDTYYTVAEAMRILGISVSRFYSPVTRATIPAATSDSSTDWLEGMELLAPRRWPYLGDEARADGLDG